MKQLQVYMVVDINILRDKGNKVRARLFARASQKQWLTWMASTRQHQNFLCVENTPHTSMQQRMDWPDRRQTNSIFTCGSSNSGPLHVPA